MSVTADELHRPLTAKTPARHFRLSPLWVGAFTGIVLAIPVAWIVLVDDPLGGEPRAIAALPQMPAPAPAVVAPQQAAPSVAPTAPEAPAEPRNTVSIITPGGAQGMQVRTVEVPEGRPTVQLRPAPDPRLVEKVPHGMIPRIGADGTRPWRHYARPVERPATNARGERRRIAILVGGLGLAAGATNDAISRLPPEVTLAFAPYGANLQTQVNRARGDGHEVMLQVPMEPFDFPANDPGPRTLLTSLNQEQNLDRLHWALSRFAGFTGVTNFMGARFSANVQTLRPMLQEIRARGLVYLDDGSSPRSQSAQVSREIGLGHAVGQVTLDGDATPEGIDAALARLEDEAQRTGQAIGVASVLPVTIERLTRWARDLDRRGFVLVPVSALITGERN